MKNCIIISAKGVNTFTKEQVNYLTKNQKIDFLEELNLLPSIEFVERLRGYRFAAVTRRIIKEIDKHIIDQLGNLKGLAVFSTGYEWIDVEYAKQKGIWISCLPDYSTLSVAEHAIGLLLMVSRRLHLSYDYARNQIDKSISLRGFEIAGKKIGIIGYGKIGQAVHRLLKGFSVEISFFDIDQHIQQSFATNFVTKNELIRNSDIIFLCASKERGALPIIGIDDVMNMKKGVSIVNPARPSLVDMSALIKGIKTETIFSYAVDEKLDDRWTSMVETGRIIQSSHTGWYSTEAIQKGIDQWVVNIKKMIDLKPMHIL
jgi:lactate dehydrogenase-like 2-hydroxyacid dehydrogenase